MVQQCIESQPESAYWHGGTPGIAVGQSVLSPQDSAQAGIYLGHQPRELPELGRVSRVDRVYFSSDREFARAFAFRYELVMPSGLVISRGSLYRVEPIRHVEEDPDFKGCGISWCAIRAVVVDVEEVDVRMRARDATRAVGQHSTWDDGRPMYLNDGRLAVTWQMEEASLQQNDIDNIVRPWTHHQVALERITQYALARTRTRP